MDGLNRAADSKENSQTNRNRSKAVSVRKFPHRSIRVADLFEPFQKGSVNLLVSLGEFGGHFVQERADSVFRSDMILAIILPARWDLPGLKGRRRTR